MKRSTFRRVGVFFLLLSGLLVGNPAFAAQNGLALRINSVEVVEDTDALILNNYFTIFDSVSGNVVTNARVNTAEIVFIDTQTKAEAQILQPDTPFYIALVLDTSGSMTGAAAALRDAAVAAIKSPPTGARFAIMTFNEQFEVVEDFLDIRNTDPLERAINKVQPVANKGTCLYDAAYSAIAELERAPKGRRAVILFTDGKDELANGSPCSKHSYADVIQYATRNDMSVPIHTIGLASQASGINSEELKNMATGTGGFSVIGGQENLTDLFRNIMEVLKSQLLAQAKLYPSAGTYNVLLRVRLDDGTIISESFNFTSSRNYTPPLPPFNLTLGGLAYSSAQGGYQVDLNITTPQQAQSLSISVWDTRSGLKVYESAHQNLSPQSSFLIPSADMINGSDYELRLTAFGADGQPIPNADGSPVFLAHKFHHEVSSVIKIDTVTIIGQDLAISMQVQNQQEIGKYQAWLVSEESNVQVPGSEYTTDTLDNGSVLHLPISAVPAGKYKLVVRALDKSGKPSASTEYPGLNYTPPVTPNFFNKEISPLLENPLTLLILISIVLILVFIAVWLVISLLRSRSMAAGHMPPLARIKGSRHLLVNQTQVGPPNEPIQAAPVPRQPTLNVPAAALRILESADLAWMGKTCSLSHFPFTIGREGCDINLENDRSVSHRHAVITYDEQKQAFFITDVSRNGILLGGQRIPKDTPTRIMPGAVLGLGPRTTAVFDFIKK
jgi:VWFA-related protein